MVKTPTLRILSLRTSLALVVLALCFGGCSRKPSPQLAPQDIETLKRIYDSRSVAIGNVITNIQVKGGGAIEVDVEGYTLLNRHEDLTKRSRSEVTSSSPESEQPAEPLWIPILLTKDLPKYFEAVNQSEGPTPQIEAYQLSGGLWCLTEIIEPENSDNRPTSARARTNHLTLRTLLYSESFVGNLPILIPTGQNNSGTSVSVTLPQGSRFRSAAVSGLVKGEVPKNRESQLLTLLLPLCQVVRWRRVSPSYLRTSSLGLFECKVSVANDLLALPKLVLAFRAAISPPERRSLDSPRPP